MVVDFQLDTGATCNVMTHADLCAIQQTKKPIMQSSTSKLKFYDNSMSQVLGQQTLDCQYKGVSHSLNFKIIRGTQKPLLPGTTCEKLGLITVNAVSSVQQCFPRSRCLAGDYHIDVDPLVKPVQHLP